MNLPTYTLQEVEAFCPSTRDIRNTYEVAVHLTPGGSHVLAAYKTRAAAELVISALRAAQSDLK